MPDCSEDFFRRRAASFDHFVGASVQVGRDVDPCARAVWRLITIEGRWLHHREIGGLGALKDTARIDADLTPRVRDVCPVAHQAASLSELSKRMDCNQANARNSFDDVAL